MEGLDWFRSPCWMKNCLGHCVTSRGFRNIIFVWNCLFFSALTQLWPTVGGKLKANGEPQICGSGPLERKQVAAFMSNTSSPASLYPQGRGLALFCCFCQGCIGQGGTPPAVSIFCLTACSLRVSPIKTSQQRSAGMFKNLSRTWKHDSKTRLAPRLNVIAS